MTTDKSDNTGLRNEMQRIETMINSPKVRDMRNRNIENHGYIRPRNASTMVLFDGPPDDPVVLMGKRNKNLKFMPGAMVFPGGSVDPGDGSVECAGDLSETTSNRLFKAMRGRPTQRGVKALGMAAVREVAEESGLLIGKQGRLAKRHPGWEDFADREVIPSLSSLRFFARAITPPGMARRFDTWFFICPASEVAHFPAGGFSPDGELEDLQWIKPEAAITENTREITRVMLVELIRRIRQGQLYADDYPAPFYHTVKSRFRKKLI